MDKYKKIKEPDNLNEIIEKAYLKAKKEESDIDMNSRKKKIIAAAVAASLTFMIGVNQSETFASYFDNVPLINKVVEFFKFDKGLEEAGKQGHVQILDKTIKSKGIESKVENVIYDSKRLAFKVSFKSDKGLDKAFLEGVTLEGENGESINNYATAISAIRGEESDREYALVDITFSNDFQLRGKSLSILPRFINLEDKENMNIKGNWKVSIPVDAEIIKKEAKHFNINRNIRVEEMDINLGNLEVFPTTSMMSINIEKDKSEYNFEGIARAKLIDGNGNEYNSRGAMGVEDKKSGVVTFESNYFVETDKLSILIEGVYVSRDEKSIFNIDVKAEEMTVESEYNFELYKVEKDQNGSIKAITIKANDSRIANENIRVIPFALMEEVTVGGEILSSDMYDRSTVYTSYEKGGQELRIDFKTPVDENISFNLSGLREYREVNKEIVIK